MWQLALTNPAHPPSPQLDHVALFGFLAAFLALVCWLEQDHSKPARFLYGPTLAALAVYGFLAGAWPLGLVLAFATINWSYRQYRSRAALRRAKQLLGQPSAPELPTQYPTRLATLFPDHEDRPSRHKIPSPFRPNDN